MSGKLTALGSNLYVGSYDLSGDIGAVTNLNAMLKTINVTAINKSAPELIPGRRDGTMTFASFFNIDAGQEHAIFSAAPRTDVQCTLAIGTPGLGTPAAAMIAKQMNYAGVVGEDGSLGFTVNMTGSGFGLEHGVLLTTGLQSFSTGTVDATSIDDGASSAFGAAAYLHVISVASGTAVFAVQDSADNSTFADVAGLVFTGATGATTQRLQTAAGLTVNRYVRLEGRGTHGAAVVAVTFVRYTEAGPI